MTTLEILQKLLLDEYNVVPEALTPQATLDSLGVDSLGLLELLFSVEEKFDIKVPTERAGLVTLDDVARYIDELLAEQHPSPVPHAEQASGGGA